MYDIYIYIYIYMYIYIYLILYNILYKSKWMLASFIPMYVSPLK